MAVRQFRDRKIKEIMEPPPSYDIYKVTEKTNIQDVAKKLLDGANRHHMVTVVDTNNIPIGLVTQTDMVDRLVAQRQEIAQNVESIMNRAFVKISEEKTIDAALGLMNSLEINKLIVVDSDEKFKGVIHRSDIIREARKLL